MPSYSACKMAVDNAERLQAQILRPRCNPAVVYVAAEMLGPGHLKHHGRGDLVVGPSAVTTEMLEGFVNAGVPVSVTDNVVGELWAKLILNCAYNAIFRHYEAALRPSFRE